MTVYAFKYCPCIYESAWSTVSLHSTCKGAYKAMKAHRLKVFYEWRNSANEYRKDFKDTFAQNWCVDKEYIQP